MKFNIQNPVSPHLRWTNPDDLSPTLSISIIIPARDALGTLGPAIASILEDDLPSGTEIIVVNDGLDAATDQLARAYPVRLIPGNRRGPAAARNIGVQAARNELLLFLDADCRVSSGWVRAHLDAHRRFPGALAVGGSMGMVPQAPFWARCDHYCSWYNVNPGRPAAWVPNHPPANLSIQRQTLQAVGCFQESLPSRGVHEEARWQGRLLRLGGRIRFEPRAAVYHVDRDSLQGFLRHNFWWAYNSISVKHTTGISRFAWVYRKPWMLEVGFLPFAVLHTLYTIVCWLRVGKMEALWMSPWLFLGRFAYALGMIKGRVGEPSGRLPAKQRGCSCE